MQTETWTRFLLPQLFDAEWLTMICLQIKKDETIDIHYIYKSLCHIKQLEYESRQALINFMVLKIW
jgi:hypothetical protein